MYKGELCSEYINFTLNGGQKTATAAAPRADVYRFGKVSFIKHVYYPTPKLNCHLIWGDGFIEYFIESFINVYTCEICNIPTGSLARCRDGRPEPQWLRTFVSSQPMVTGNQIIYTIIDQYIILLCTPILWDSSLLLDQFVTMWHFLKRFRAPHCTYNNRHPYNLQPNQIARSYKAFLTL